MDNNQDGLMKDNIYYNNNNNIDITGNILMNITQFKNEEVNKEELNKNILFTLLLLKQDTNIHYTEKS